MADKKHRVIILGAGFSKPSGLPLADELWRQILNRSKTLCGRAGMLRDDLDAYIEYHRDCDGVELTPDTINFEELREKMLSELTSIYDEKENILSADHMREFERMIMLQIIDSQWKDHLLGMDYLKEGIGLRGYGQRDPLIE